jgi:hypothetical protein
VVLVVLNLRHLSTELVGKTLIVSVKLIARVSNYYVKIRSDTMLVRFWIIFRVKLVDMCKILPV